MKKIDIKKAAGVSVLSLGLVVGLAGFAGASSGTIGTTGPDSENEITHESNVDMDFNNDNDVNLTNKNDQHASSGKTEVRDNTRGGDAESGRAANANAVNANIQLDNSQTASGFDNLAGGGGSNSASINNTGPDSENEVKYESRVNVDVDNDNNIHVYNNNDQYARSGDAEVEHNTTGGSATSGDVSNTNSSSFTVRITN